MDLHTKFEKDWTWNTDVIAILKRLTETLTFLADTQPSRQTDIQNLDW